LYILTANSAYLSPSTEVFESLLEEDEEESEESHEQPMTSIPKHHREEEGKSDDGVGCWGRGGMEVHV